MTNIIGLTAGSMLILMSISTWDFLSSAKFKTTSQSKNETGIYKKIFGFVSSDAFKYTACISTALIGKWYLKYN
jgi:hypothetical protein